MLPASVLLQVVAVISAVQATAYLWMRILCQHSSNGKLLFRFSPWLHFRMKAATLPHQTDRQAGHLFVA